MNDETNEIYEYIKMNHLGDWLIGGLFIALGLIGTILVLHPGLLIPVAMGAFLVGNAYRQDSEVKKRLAEIESSPDYPILLDDFRNGKRFMEDHIRIGQVYVIGAKTGAVYKVRELFQVYQYIHKTNMVEDGRELQAVIRGEDGKAKQVSICKLKAKRAFHKTTGEEDELKMAILNLLLINPAIKVGYR